MVQCTSQPPPPATSLPFQQLWGEFSKAAQHK